MNKKSKASLFIALVAVGSGFCISNAKATTLPAPAAVCIQYGAFMNNAGYNAGHK
jgi:hypothetical protein